ncbi:Uncharacterised protein [Mycobacteroides abscessus subsp. abscessus]|nr:Uncharacterised protein [Mycobacteroides abscessus subsp. abscessus]
MSPPCSSDNLVRSCTAASVAITRSGTAPSAAAEADVDGVDSVLLIVYLSL